ncbi:FixH family protein [Fulvivirga sp. M361]|uniref:FixH family protein n=1 Tax=Fulvivirga sp. M361 TaxID=2594266 RepID=UPI00117BA191|nr:FixH family protein [Fulvivirga sp. M361]TRX52666.1 FixH family protein [Fulvivirga sp. M361]
MNWGLRIVVAFIGFVAVIITLVVISMRQNINLVAEDYYVQEIAYQKQIDRVKNHMDLGQLGLEVELEPATNQIVVKSSSQGELKGTVYFFRPSDERLDKSYHLTLSDGKQLFNSSDFAKGLWKVKVSWTENEKEYYYEKLLVI